MEGVVEEWQWRGGGVAVERWWNGCGGGGGVTVEGVVEWLWRGWSLFADTQKPLIFYAFIALLQNQLIRYLVTS